MPTRETETGPGEVDLLVAGGAVLTLDGEDNLFAPGFVAIRDGEIAAVGPAQDAARLRARSTLDATGSLVMPGLINGHTHAAMTLFRGMADDLPLQSWLMEHIFPAEARLTPDMVYWGSMLAIAEMLASGITSFADGYFFEREVARAAHETGMRAIVGQGVIDFPAPGVPDPAKNVDAARDFLDEWTGVSRLIIPAVFCHTPHTCSEKTLLRSKELANERNALFQTHLAETAWEVEEVLKLSGKRPGELLSDLGVLDGSTHLVHCLYISEGEMEAIAEAGAGVVHCPESNLKLASGLAPVRNMLDAGINIALGTDGAASNNDLDILSEKRTAQALHDLGPGEGLAAATHGGAGALGLGRVGRLAEGFAGDLIVADMGSPHLACRTDPRSAALFGLRRGDIRHTVVGGRVLYENGRYTTLDIARVKAEVNAIKEKYFK